MDLSVYDKNNNFEHQILLINGESLQTNKNSDVVTVWVAKGTHSNAQLSSFATAFSIIKTEFSRRGITILSEQFNNDAIRNNRWSATLVIDKMMMADIHIMIGSFFVGLLGADESWNMSNIQSNIDRLQYHLGIPMGRFISCPIIRRKKIDLYYRVSKFDLCVPSLAVPLVDGIYTCKEVIKDIESFVAEINLDPQYLAPNNPFVVKLVDSSGKHFSGMRIAIKHCINGTNGICNALREYLDGEHRAQIIGVISHAMIQPDILHNSVAEVLVFNGKPLARNSIKRGKGPCNFGRDRMPTYEFASRVVSELRQSCPEIISDQLLCVKMFHYRNKFILNSISGFDSEIDAVYSSTYEIQTYIREWWINQLRDMINHLIQKRT